MKRTDVDAMTGGRRALYVAHFDLSLEEATSLWGPHEEFDEAWDLGRRMTFAFQLESGSFVSLTTVEGQPVPGFSLFVRTDDAADAYLQSVLRQFLTESGMEENRVVHLGFERS
ncbi:MULTISPECIES: hypothetical protein [unclassified Streptomyces]|uniref:hypothetical protein n=1 Tax=unclassified Streptomyces TaxID=2593676 RepID=UPI0004CB3F23|nr:hypothetical protein [Streptomyces sp. NRRL F-2747]